MQKSTTRSHVFLQCWRNRYGAMVTQREDTLQRILYSGKFLRIQIFASLIFPPEVIFAFCGTGIDHAPYGTWIFMSCSRASVASRLADMYQLWLKMTKWRTAARLPCIKAYSPILTCCAGVYLTYAPLQFEDGVRALSLTALLAALIVARLTGDERCPMVEGRTLSAGFK